jgi:catechol 2,3-dioxygenase-like lactoylglutathione lyase family enzyme
MDMRPGIESGCVTHPHILSRLLSLAVASLAIVSNMERVVGIGGYFFRATDPEALADWYETSLGIPSMSTGGSWDQEAGPTVFAPFPVDTDYFGRSDQQTMLNFRVTSLDAMLTQLRAAGATVEDEISEASFGRFGHAVDPEGNRFELWEYWKDPET